MVVAMKNEGMRYQRRKGQHNGKNVVHSYWLSCPNTINYVKSRINVQILTAACEFVTTMTMRYIQNDCGHCNQ